MADVRSIGIFDSGLGGLTVARHLVSALPHEALLYVGDTARCPYGTRPVEEVAAFALQIAHWLQAQEVKLIVVACNTATAAALPLLQETSSVPVIGVVEPGARAGIAKSKAKKIGVVATPATVFSQAYLQAAKALDTDIQVFQAACPELVGLVETYLARGKEGDLQHAALPFIRSALKPLLEKKIDTLVLGCTHFPLLKPAFQEAVGADVTLVDSAEETQKEVARLLQEADAEAPEDRAGCHQFVTTSRDKEAFRQAGAYIFKQPLQEIGYLDYHTLSREV